MRYIKISRKILLGVNIILYKLLLLNVIHHIHTQYVG